MAINTTDHFKRHAAPHVYSRQLRQEYQLKRTGRRHDGEVGIGEAMVLSWGIGRDSKVKGIVIGASIRV